MESNDVVARILAIGLLIGILACIFIYALIPNVSLKTVHSINQAYDDNRITCVDLLVNEDKNMLGRYLKEEWNKQIGE